jgi:hypothetical protein
MGFCSVSSGQSICIDFETDDDGSSLANGQLIEAPDAFGTYFDLTSTGANSGCATFDTTDPGPNSAGPDPDLLVNRGNVAILQDDGSTCAGSPCIFAVPNDDASLDGIMTFDFAPALALGLKVIVTSIDVVDRNGNGRDSVTVTDTAGLKRTASIPAEWTGEPPLEIGWGELDLLSGSDTESPNIPGLFATVITDTGYDATNIASIEVTFAGSGGVDNFKFVLRECDDKDECDDGNTCTTDSCDVDGMCVNEPVLCSDDGLFCNGDEVCDPATGACVSEGSPCTRRDTVCCEATDTCSECCDDTDCDDGVACTADTCVAGMCQSAPDDGACDDGLFCNGAETCDPINDCQAGTPVDCGDSVGCTDDSCDEAADACVNAPNNAVCDDGEFCNGTEVCDPANDCQAGTPRDCDDGVGCTDDSCDEAADACVNAPDNAVCDDGEFCNGTEVCDPTNDCQAGAPRDCDDGVGCTDDSCNEATDSCEHTPNDGLCDDGDFCNGVETCDATGDCQAGTAPDCNDNVGCTDDSCDEAADACVNAPDNAVCDDGEFCNGTEVCDPTNDCQAGAPRDCDDGVGCTDDSCDEMTDSCDHTPNDGLCDDGDFCNGVETCDATGDCQVGTAPDCNDNVSCTDDSCNEATDSCDHTPNDGLCDDGGFCNGVETCDATGDCQAGTAPDCNDNVSCTNDSCDEATDSCVNAPNNANCDDGAFCNGVETCDPTNDCQAGSAPNCDDSVPCTADSCDEGSDSCVNAPDNSNCTDDDPCTIDTCTPTGCLSIVIPGCGTGACCLSTGDCIDNVTTSACASQGGGYKGDSTFCAGDNDNNGVDDFCELPLIPVPVPAASPIGMVILCLLFGCGGLIWRRRNR